MNEFYAKQIHSIILPCSKFLCIEMIGWQRQLLHVITCLGMSCQETSSNCRRFLQDSSSRRTTERFFGRAVRLTRLKVRKSNRILIFRLTFHIILLSLIWHSPKQPFIPFSVRPRLVASVLGWSRLWETYVVYQEINQPSAVLSELWLKEYFLPRICMARQETDGARLALWSHGEDSHVFVQTWCYLEVNLIVYVPSKLHGDPATSEPIKVLPYPNFTWKAFSPWFRPKLIHTLNQWPWVQSKKVLLF